MKRDFQNYYCSVVGITHNVFKKFQAEVVAARDHCSIVDITQVESAKLVAINDGSEKRDRVVHGCTLNKFGACSCKLFERMGIPCRHIILTLRSEKIYELPSTCIMKRWEIRYEKYKQQHCFSLLYHVYFT
jgi:hypothetical protein